MYCASCGKEMNEGERICSGCGAAVAAPVEEAVAPAKPCIDTNPILVQGILSLAFANTLFLSWLGIIFGVKAKKKIKDYLAQGYELTGKARVGRILAKIGTILGIVGTVCCVLYMVLMALDLLLILGLSSY